MSGISEALLDRVATRHPSPVADAVVALTSSESPHERRDRVVETFRVLLRYLAAVGLAARLARAPGTDGDELPSLVDALRRRSLTDGQWWHLLRELVRPWRERAGDHPLPVLLEVVSRPAFGRDVDALLGMRKSETVAHGTTGDLEDVAEILTVREPALARLLEATEPIHAAARLVVPLVVAGDVAQLAVALVGTTPARGRHRRIALGDGIRAEPGRCLLVGPDGAPVLDLDPIVLHAVPAAGAIAEVFFLDGRSGRGGARYLSLPAANERTEPAVWERVDAAFSPTTGANATATTAARPYRGLSRFDARDAALFFGRDDEIQQLANRIRSNGLVTLTGPSGSGKSSLLAAGVAPALALDDGAPHREIARRGATVITVRPGRDPLRELATALDEAEPTPARIAARLRELAGDRLAVVVVDQAEELLTLAPRERALAAVELLAELGASETAAIRVVLSVREDFFASLALLAPLRGIYDRQVMVLGPLDREAMLRALTEPARRFGLSFETGVAETIVDVLLDRPGALPLLQFAADQMWDRRAGRAVFTRAVYDEIGGVEGALAGHAEAILDGLVPAQREIARQIFLRLVTREGTRSTVMRTELAALGRDADVVISTLEEARLLASHQDGEGAAVCEIVHEALLVHWPRLAGWRKAEGDGALHVTHLADAARAWRRSDRGRDLLWRGDILAEHRRWRERARLHLTSDEDEFVAASETAERHGRRGRLTIASAIGLVLAAIAIIAALQWRLASAAEKRAVAAQARARVGEAQAREAADRAEMQTMLIRAREYGGTGHTAEEIAVLRALARPDAGDEARRLAVIDGGLIWKAHQRLARGLARDAGAAYRSADGARLVASIPGFVVAWDTATGRELARVPVVSRDGKAIQYPDFPAVSPTGRFAVILECLDVDDCKVRVGSWKLSVTSGGGRWVVRDLDRGTELFARVRTLAINALAFAPDDSAIAVRSDEQETVDVIDRDGTHLRTIDTSSCPSGRLDRGGLALSPKGRFLALECDDATIHIVEIGTGTVVLATRDGSPASGGFGRGLVFLDDARLIGSRLKGETEAFNSGDDSRRLTIWDAGTGRILGHGVVETQGATSATTALRWMTGEPRVALPTPDSIFSRRDPVGFVTPWPQTRGDKTLLTLHGDLVVFGNGQPGLGVMAALPPLPEGPCLIAPRGEPHVLVSLDDGGRILVDEQEISIDSSWHDYAATTSLEVPVRELRPAQTADNGMCLAWETSPRGPERRHLAVPDGAIAAISPDGARAAVVNADGYLDILETATGTTLRRVESKLSKPRWVGAGTLIAALAGQDDDPSPLAVLDVAGGPPIPFAGCHSRRPQGEITYLPCWRIEDELSVVRVADGSIAGHLPYPDDYIIGVLPGDRGMLSSSFVLLGFDGSRRQIQSDLGHDDWINQGMSTSADEQSDELGQSTFWAADPAAHYVAIAFARLHVLDLVAGHELPSHDQVFTPRFAGDQIWALADRGGPTLIRIDPATGDERILRLSSSGAPLHTVDELLEVSPDLRRVTVRYHVTELLEGVGIWDAETGTPLWLGPSQAVISGGWISMGGRVYEPDFDVDNVLANTGERTNLRVCRDDYRAVPVEPPPAADTYWAPESTCAE